MKALSNAAQREESAERVRALYTKRKRRDLEEGLVEKLDPHVREFLRRRLGWKRFDRCVRNCAI